MTPWAAAQRQARRIRSSRNKKRSVRTLTNLLRAALTHPQREGTPMADAADIATEYTERHQQEILEA